MFCRRCLYDLQGQQSPRCPECGTEFAFDDPRSFLPVRGRAASLLHRIRSRRRDVLIGLTFLLSFCYGLALHRLPNLAQATSPSWLAESNLRDVIIAWRIHASSNPQATGFDAEAARMSLTPSFSPYTQPGWARVRSIAIYLLRRAPLFVVPTMVYLFIVAIIEVRRPRRIAITLLLMLGFVLYASASPYTWGERITPGTYAFLDDIVTVAGINPTAVPNYTIAAYDAKSFQGEGVRWIAFADGHLEWMTDEKAKWLFEVQGLDYPVQGDSVAATE